MVALFDHEEVGSNSAQGAGSPVMLDALSRITDSFSSNSKVGNPLCLFYVSNISYLCHELLMAYPLMPFV